MYNIVFEYYNLSNYDSNVGGGYGKIGSNPAVGLNKNGGSFPVYVKGIDDSEDVDDDIEIDNVDLSSKLNGPEGTFDIGSRVDRSSFVSNARLNLSEEYSTNPVRKGISPYKIKNFTGPAIGSGGSNQAFRTTGTGVRTSGPYGNSRATYPRYDQELEPLMFGDDIVNKYERSLRKHQRKIKKIKNLLKELDN